MSSELNIVETLKILPEQPGVYLMQDAEGTIIYVGKAKILKNRVRSYFHGPKDPKTTVLVQKIASINWIVTRNEYEALILENNLIKKHTPRYNINLKDGKTYPLIRITKEKFPRVFRTRRIIEDGSQYFGPFTMINAVDQYLELIEQNFPLRKCRGPLDKIRQPCLYYHIGRCPAPCAGKISELDYTARVGAVAKLLSGKNASLLRDLEKKMKQAAAAQQYEAAAHFRDGIRAIGQLGVGQQVQDFDPGARDYISWDIQDEKVSFSVLRMRSGRMVESDTFRTEGFSDEEDLALQFFFQYYHSSNPPPAFVYVALPSMRHDLAQYCKDEFSLKVAFPNLTEKRDTSILEMARENARQDMRKRLHDTGNLDALRDLQSLLSLPRLPMRIEGFDIAHLHGKHTVAAMVSFWKGLPDQAQYRIFNIKSLAGGIDDFGSIREAVARRYTRILNEALERPDLLLIDGGKGQLSAACAVLEALGINDIPVIALAKEREEIFVPGRSEPYTLPFGNQALRILQHVRDESHRFGTSRNQKLRSSDLKLSTLEAIPGIGPKRALLLLETFGSLESIRAAAIEDLRARGHLSQTIAEALHAALHEVDAGAQALLAAEPDAEYSDD